MPRALLKLLWMKTYGNVRRAVRVQGNPKKLVLLVIGLLVVAMWLGPMVAVNLRSSRSASDFMDVYGPLMLAGFTVFSLLVSGGETAIAFQPAEVDMLFPGPFTRRQLLMYKMMSGMVGSLTGALIFSILFLPYAGAWVWGFAAWTLALWTMQFLGTGGALVKQIVGEAAYTRARRAALIAVLGGACVLAAMSVRGRSLGDVGGVGGVQALVRTVNESKAGVVLLSPFRVFTNLAGSRTAGEALPWAAVAACMSAALGMLVVRLDADYTEAAIRASERHAERMRRARSGNMFAPGSVAAPGKPVRSRRARMPSWLGGAAPVAWRQWTTMARGGKKWAFQIMVMLGVATAILYSMRRADSPGVGPWIGVGVLGYITVILAAILRFDFRADLDHIETLKALPLEPRSIALGELLLPVLVLAGVQWILMAGITYLFGWEWKVLVGALAAAPVVNFLVLGVENLMFLMFPARLTNRGVADFSMMGRQTVLFMGKGVIYMGIAAVAGGTAALVRWMTGSTGLALGTAWVVLAAGAVGVVLAVGRAFRAFDVSADMPA